MGNSTSTSNNHNIDNVVLEIQDSFILLMDNMSQISFGRCDVTYYDHDWTTRQNCIKCIKLAHDAFNSKTDIRNITSTYIMPLIQNLNALPLNFSSTAHMTRQRDTCIKMCRKINGLINKYIVITEQNVNKITSLENENSQLKKTISEQSANNPYVQAPSAPKYDAVIEL